MTNTASPARATSAPTPPAATPATGKEASSVGLGDIEVVVDTTEDVVVRDINEATAVVRDIDVATAEEILISTQLYLVSWM